MGHTLPILIHLTLPMPREQVLRYPILQGGSNPGGSDSQIRALPEVSVGERGERGLRGRRKSLERGGEKTDAVLSLILRLSDRAPER